MPEKVKLTATQVRIELKDPVKFVDILARVRALPGTSNIVTTELPNLKTITYTLDMIYEE